MQELIRTVVILGGGTAGWMTASYLKRAFGETVNITLIEAATIPKIGVGRATIPNLQKVFLTFWGCGGRLDAALQCIVQNGRQICQLEAPVIRRWRRLFLPSFGLIPNCHNVPLSHYWVLRQHEGKEDRPVAYACYKDAPLADAKLSPRRLDGTRITNYAWHFDAHLVAEYLQKLSVGWGVNHIVDELESVEQHADGSIAALRTRAGGRYEADLFVDCSGFKGLLINKTLGEPFIDMKDQLLCDSAVATAVPHDDARFGVEPYTSAIAMNHGWTWKIPMLTRFGSGYVYASDFVSQDEATDEFLKLWKLDANKVKLNQIKFRTGRNRRAWVKNCVSIGLASCFLEPLESTGIYFIYAAIYQLAKHFPDKSFNPSMVDAFNSEIAWMYDDCRDFVQAHYFTTMRQDTPFWRANKNELNLSESIRDKIDRYKAGLVVGAPLADAQDYYDNFETEFRNFWTNASYYCIFSGMGCMPAAPLAKIRYNPAGLTKADEMFAHLRSESDTLKATLPSCYEYLKVLHGK